MIKKIIAAALASLLVLPVLVQAQSVPAPKVFSLNELIDFALQNSPAYRSSENQRTNFYWRYRMFRSNYMPQVALQGTIPTFNRAFVPITQPDGTFMIRNVFNSTSSLDLTVSQNVGLTGGSIFVGSTLGRFDNFGENRGYGYNANPLFVGFNQPIFGFNRLRWDKRIEPLHFEESQRRFSEDMEGIALDVSDRFFNLLLAQISLEIAQKNKANNDTLFKIAEGRYSLGKIAENDLLQLELSVMRAEQDVAQARLQVESGTLHLKAYLGLTDSEQLQLVEPTNLPVFEVSQQIALEQSRNNRQQIVVFKRQLLEADRQVAQAQGENGFRANLFASYGLTQRAQAVPELYVNPQGQQQVNFGFQVPILDWGRTQSQIKMARANQEMVRTNVAQQEIMFDQQIILAVEQFRMSREQLRIAVKSDEIALKRYEITKNRYVIGKVGITDLNIALQEKDEARRNYVSALRGFWTGYFTLRQLTLYDFVENKPLQRVELN
jgi:outer membrane protein